jgi:hypothetical protein
MNGEYGYFVAILDVQRMVRAQFEYENLEEDRPSRTGRTAAALRQRCDSIVGKMRETSKRREVAQDPVSIGD